MTLGNGVLRLARTAAAGIGVIMAVSAVSAAPLPHPRLYLNSPTMTRLQLAKTNNTAEWTRLKNWCDSHLGQNMGEGYQYIDWYYFTLNYALAYRLTGNNAYGNEGVKYLKAMLRDRHQIGDGLGGANAITIDSGYVSRSMGVGVAQGRDWLAGAPDLTAAIILECTTRMNDWYNWIHKPGGTWGIGNPLNNYFAGHFGMTYSAAIAFEGDPGYNAAWMTKAESMWVEARDAFNVDYDGGDSPEGWNYAPRAVRHMVMYPWARESGTTLPDHWNEIDISSEIPRGGIAMLHPSRQLVSDDGRWSGDTKGDPRSSTFRLMAILTDTDPTAKGLAMWYVNHCGELGLPEQWEAMLYTDRTIAEIAPTIANMGGLTRNMAGHAVARSADWNNLDATFVDVVARTYASEEANFGEVKMSSRRKLLLVDGQTWQLESEFANVPRIDGNHTYHPYQEYWHDNANMTVDFSDGVYSHFKINRFDQAYDGVGNDTPSTTYFRRHIVFLPPDHMVVYDNITVPAPASSHRITEQWHVMGNPTISGDTATLVNGTAKLFLRTVSPGATITKTDTDASREGTYRVDALVNESLTNKIVTLFETAPSTQASMTPHQTLSPTGFTGIHVQNATAPKILLLSTTPNPQDTSLSFSFVPQATSTRVVVIGMKPSTAFQITSSAGAGGSINVNVIQGSGTSSTSNGTLTFNASLTASAVEDWSLYN